MPNRVEKYITIKEVGTSATGKTLIWDVICKGEHCGRIAWYGPFRKYCFIPQPGSLYDHDCMRLLADRCEEFTKQHYAQKKNMV